MQECEGGQNTQLVSVCLGFLARTNSRDEQMRILESALNCVKDKTTERCAGLLQGTLHKLSRDNKVIKRGIQIFAQRDAENQKVWVAPS